MLHEYSTSISRSKCIYLPVLFIDLYRSLLYTHVVFANQSVQSYMPRGARFILGHLRLVLGIF